MRPQRVLVLACLLAPHACGGFAASRVAPASLPACIGSWSVDWYDGGMDRGVGTVRIGADGSVDGMLRDDAFRSAEWNQAVGAILKGRLSRIGVFEGSVTWSTGRAGWNLTGQMGLDSSGILRLEARPPGGADDVERTLVVIFHR
jgi:hypothetical protein